MVFVLFLQTNAIYIITKALCLISLYMLVLCLKLFYMFVFCLKHITQWLKVAYKYYIII
ncbi:hypothetical protein Hanom_Chr07g00599141 [Helianthus anomalus]